MPSNARDYADTTHNWTKLSPKQMKFQEFSNKVHVKAI
jgi:hypothetical protein